MSEQLNKKTTGRIRIEPSVEFDKMLSQLVGSESVKEVDRII